MSEQSVIEVQQGIWINAEWLRQAGLGLRYRVVIEPGEIRIVDASFDSAQKQPTEAQRDFLRALGRDAQPGGLPNAAEDHDQYLYSRK
ncbi:MAG: hypothetical protein U0Z53_24230 [Blastocatellia bacterium]